MATLRGIVFGFVEPDVAHLVTAAARESGVPVRLVPWGQVRAQGFPFGAAHQERGMMPVFCDYTDETMARVQEQARLGVGLPLLPETADGLREWGRVFERLYRTWRAAQAEHAEEHQLREELERAVEREDYEAAASIRDVLSRDHSSMVRATDS